MTKNYVIEMKINIMKKINTIVAVIMLVITVSCQTKKTENKSINENITVQAFEEKLKTDVQLIDVRTPDEFASGHLSKAHNIDVTSENWDSEITKLDKSKPILVYCKSGNRSATAAEKLVVAGFKTVYNLEGGIMKWQVEGKSVEQSEMAQTNNGLSLADYNNLVTSDKFVLVDFNATWCGPCKKLSPILDKIATEKKDKLTLLKIDADENQDLVLAKAIDGIPYLEMFKNGKLIWSFKGYIDEEALRNELKNKGLN